MSDKVSISSLRKKANALKKQITELENSAGVGLADKMQKKGERFISKDKGLLTKFNMKVINTLLDLRENQLVSSSRYDKLRDELINVQEQISGGKNRNGHADMRKGGMFYK